jgi:hypothetical protein
MSSLINNLKHTILTLRDGCFAASSGRTVLFFVIYKGAADKIEAVPTNTRQKINPFALRRSSSGRLEGYRSRFFAFNYLIAIYYADTLRGRPLCGLLRANGFIFFVVHSTQPPESKPYSPNYTFSTTAAYHL